MTHYRWTVVGFGFLAVIITYFDRTALSYAIGPIESTFHLSNTDFGIIASAFGLGYMLMSVLAGVIVDHFGARKIWSLFSVLWSIVCAGIGLATGFIWLAVFRVLLGLTEGASFPSLLRVSTDWLPLTERARAIAIGLAAVPFASVIGAPFISHLVAWFGWRLSFIILGVSGVAWGIVWYVIFRDQPEQSKHVSKEELSHIRQESKMVESSQVTTKTTWQFMLFNPAFIVNNYADFTFGYVLFFAITWLPGYLEQTYHIKLKEVGWYLMIPWLTATVLLVFGGFLSDWLWRKTQSIRQSRSHLIWCCQILSALSFVPVVLCHSLLISIIGMSLGLGFCMMPNSAYYAINADLAQDRAATSLGIMNFAFATSGVVAPLITGWLSTLTGHFTAAVSLMIVLAFSSALLVFLFQHPDKVLQKKNGG